LKKQTIQILLAAAGIGVAVYIYFQSKKKQKLVASPADKPGSPYYTATGSSSPAGLSSAAQQTATQGLQQPSGTAKNPGGTKPDVWGAAASAVGGLLAGLFGKGGGGKSGGGSKLGSGLGSNYKGPGSLSGGTSSSGKPDDPLAADRNEFGEPITGGPEHMAADRDEFGEPITGGPEHMAADRDPLTGDVISYSGGNNDGNGASDFSGYGGNDGVDTGGGDGSEGSFDGSGYEGGGGGDEANFESD